MSILWHPVTPKDIEPSLAIQTKHRGDTVVGIQAAVEAWRVLMRDPFFASAVFEADPPIKGYRQIGFGASVLVSSSFADAEIAAPRPDLNSRIIESVCSRQPVLATHNEVARANAGEGVDVVVLYGTWRDELVNMEQRHEVQTLLASTFTDWHRGFRVRRILHETANESSRDFVSRSTVYQPVAEFPDLGRTIHLMTRDTVKLMPASLGNVIFSYREPLLRLRSSDQRLLAAALTGTTDPELAGELGVSLSAVKARWRSTFERIGETRPHLVIDVEDHDGRGSQKRHRVLSYLRTHPEELRPYDWKSRLQSNTA